MLCALTFEKEKNFFVYFSFMFVFLCYRNVKSLDSERAISWSLSRDSTFIFVILWVLCCLCVFERRQVIGLGKSNLLRFITGQYVYLRDIVGFMFMFVLFMLFKLCSDQLGEALLRSSVECCHSSEVYIYMYMYIYIFW